MAEHVDLLPRLSSRQDFFDYLDGYAVDAAGELLVRRQSKGLVKTYMLETVRQRVNAPRPTEVLESLGFDVGRVDDSLYTIAETSSKPVLALLELLDDRYPVIYTAQPSEISDPWVHRLVHGSPWLDRLWLSAPMFDSLWSYVRLAADPRRFTRMSFEHEAFYETPELPTDESMFESDPDSARDDPSARETEVAADRRSSRFSLVERISVIEQKLPTLQSAYLPLHSITQLRIPAANRGGHDFFFDGKVTNRSASFLDHRANVRFVVDLYRDVTTSAEEQAWVGAVERGPDSQAGIDLEGAPVYLRFSHRLDAPTFDRWIAYAFGRKRSRFRIGGRVIRLGPTKAHLYGIDRHLWQPIVMELTADHVVAFLPRGTCGNTIHRLITNVQRYVDPALEAWVGERPYADIVGSSLQSSLAHDSGP